MASLPRLDTVNLGQLSAARGLASVVAGPGVEVVMAASHQQLEQEEEEREQEQQQWQGWAAGGQQEGLVLGNIMDGVFEEWDLFD